MTEKPNSVCARCLTEIKPLGNGWVDKAGRTACGIAVHWPEPVAEPAEPSASPWTLEQSLHGDWKAVSAEPTAENGPQRREPCEDCVWHSCTGLQGGCSCKCHKPAPQPVAGEGPQLPSVMDHKYVAGQCHLHGCHFLFLQNGGNCAHCPAPEGTPKLEEIVQCEMCDGKIPGTSRSIVNIGGKWMHYSNTRYYPCAILRPFITPACSPQIDPKVFARKYRERAKSNERESSREAREGSVAMSQLYVGFSSAYSVVADEWEAIVAATPASTEITCPACHGKVTLCHNKAGVWLQCQPGGCGKTRQINKTEDLLPFFNQASTGEANGPMSPDTNHAFDPIAERSSYCKCSAMKSVHPQEKK